MKSGLYFRSVEQANHAPSIRHLFKWIKFEKQDWFKKRVKKPITSKFKKEISLTK